MTFTLSARSERAHQRAAILAEQAAAVHTIQECRYSEGFEEAYAKALSALVDEEGSVIPRQLPKHKETPGERGALQRQILAYLQQAGEPKTASEIGEAVNRSAEGVWGSMVGLVNRAKVRKIQKPRTGPHTPSVFYEAID